MLLISNKYNPLQQRASEGRNTFWSRKDLVIYDILRSTEVNIYWSMFVSRFGHSTAQLLHVLYDNV